MTRVDVAVVGAGSIGISVAYHLLTRHGVQDVALIDAGDPMALTSAQSGENYALSGFGTMAAIATGALCADWMAGAAQPDYARLFTLDRYQDQPLMAELRTASRGVL